MCAMLMANFSTHITFRSTPFFFRFFFFYSILLPILLPGCSTVTRSAQPFQAYAKATTPTFQSAATSAADVHSGVGLPGKGSAFQPGALRSTSMPQCRRGLLPAGT